MILQINTQHPLYPEVLSLRERILRIPLGLPLSAADTLQDTSQVILAYIQDHKNVTACLLLDWINKTTLKMRQLAVDVPFQKAGIGKALALYAENYALENRATKIVLHARETVVPFYKKLGYQAVGEVFTEVSLPHQAMEKGLRIFL